MEIIAEINKMSLVFPLKFRQAATLRDVFVQAVMKPIDTLFKAPQYLEIIRDLDLKIVRGDRVALIGVNGVGKTTLCRTIAGIYRPNRGSIKINGNVRAIFDTSVGIFPELTGRENAHILTNFLFPNLERREERVQEALEFTELGSFLDTPYKFYSNGMQTRLCLSVLTMEPTDLLILDEVFEGADQFFREKISNRVVDIIERSGAVIFVSHNESQLLRTCNRGIVIAGGKAVFDGSVEEALAIYRDDHDPRKKVVAQA
ncbi:MAG TPA: ATP-binding cassette domain-containing protein [Bdellovibrionales bacterium]|nr:ATP-binding cassette domain-containing protein [Bdellovibrionales bacterium]